MCDVHGLHPSQYAFSDYLGNDCNYPYQYNPPCIVQAPYFIAARSYHPGGVNALMADGSVQFFKNSIDYIIWRRSAHRRGARSSRPTPTERVAFGSPVPAAARPRGTGLRTSGSHHHRRTAIIRRFSSRRFSRPAPSPSPRPSRSNPPSGDLVLTVGTGDFGDGMVCPFYRLATGRTLLPTPAWASTLSRRLARTWNRRPLRAHGTTPVESRLRRGRLAVDAIGRRRSTCGRRAAVAGYGPDVRVYDEGLAFCYTLPRMRGGVSKGGGNASPAGERDHGEP